MFLNTYTPKLDEKGRFFLPAKYRDELAEGLVITRAQERCLVIYPVAKFVAMTRDLTNSLGTIKEVRDYQRMLGSGASDEIPDKQGRITVPPSLRRYAGLDKDIVVAGLIDRVEVWDLAAWEAYSEQQESVFASLNQQLPGTENT